MWLGVYTYIYIYTYIYTHYCRLVAIQPQCKVVVSVQIPCRTALSLICLPLSHGSFGSHVRLIVYNPCCMIRTKNYKNVECLSYFVYFWKNRRTCYKKWPLCKSRRTSWNTKINRSRFGKVAKVIKNRKAKQYNWVVAIRTIAKTKYYQSVDLGCAKTLNYENKASI